MKLNMINVIKSDNAVSEVVGMVMILSITILVIGSLILFGVPMIESGKNKAKMDVAESSFLSLQNDIEEVVRGPIWVKDPNGITNIDRLGPSRETEFKLMGGTLDVYPNHDNLAYQYPFVSLTIIPTTVTVGQLVIFIANVSGGKLPYNYNWAGLPPPCSGTNNIIACFPNTTGIYNITVNVTDVNNNNVIANEILTVNPAPLSANLNIGPMNIIVNQSMNFTVNAGGGKLPYNYSWTGLPSPCYGTGNIRTCSPNKTGIYNITVNVTDSTVLNQTINVSGILMVNSLSANLTINRTIIIVNQSVRFNVSISGGNPPYNYNWTGLPPPCSGTNNIITCSPNKTGIYNIIVNATNYTASSNQTINVTGILTVNPSLSVNLIIIPTIITVSQSVIFIANVSGGNPPYTYSWTGLPPPFCFGTNNIITCSPSVTGTYNITVNATDSTAPNQTINVSGILTVMPIAYGIVIPLSGIIYDTGQESIIYENGAVIRKYEGGDPIMISDPLINIYSTGDKTTTNDTIITISIHAITLDRVLSSAGGEGKAWAEIRPQNYTSIIDPSTNSPNYNQTTIRINSKYPNVWRNFFDKKLTDAGLNSTGYNISGTFPLNINITGSTNNNTISDIFLSVYESRLSVRVR